MKSLKTIMVLTLALLLTSPVAMADKKSKSKSKKKAKTEKVAEEVKPVEEAPMLAMPTAEDYSYRRPSITTFLVSRTDQNMYDRIQEQYLAAPMPEQYNDHNLSVRIVSVGKKGEYRDSINDWLDRHQVASRMVGKWFDRDILTGECSMDLVKSRGLYNATELDRELASRSARGMAMLEDAGEELIGNTFVLVHEATYIDKAKRSKNVALGLKILGGIAGAVTGISAVSDLADNVASLTETYKGFKVKFKTRLYRLDWNDNVANNFYTKMYATGPDADKREAFEMYRDRFRLLYVGDVESSGAQTSFIGINEEHPEIMIRKACVRAIDENVCKLQQEYEEFRVKSPIASINGDDIMVSIGLKEGIDEKSEYELLEPEEKKGRIVYKRVGVIVPVKDKIWDNRYMAKEEGAIGADLNATTFRKKSGKDPYVGLLVRQLK